MTLIARANFNGVSFYLGDLLLSRKGKSGDAIDIPAANDINKLLPESSMRHVSGMVQKLNILSDRLIVAWAGSRSQAHTMIRELSELDRSATTLFRADIEKLIMGVPENDRDELSLIGSVCLPNYKQEGDLYIEHFSYRTTKCTRPGEVIHVAGSGADDLINLMPRIVNGRPPPSNIDEGLYEWVKQTAIGTLGQFVGQEMLLGHNLPNWWGGAFETAVIEDQAFKKIKDTLFTFWRLLPDESGEFLHLGLIPKFLKYDYFEDVLIVQKLDSEITSDEKLKIVSHDCRLYLPIHRTLKGEYDFSQITFPTLEPTTLCCFTLFNNNGNIKCGNRIYHGASNMPFRAVIFEEDIALSFHDQLFEGLVKDGQQATGMPVKFTHLGH